MRFVAPRMESREPRPDGGWTWPAHKGEGPGQRFKITWGQWVGKPECPYLRRWVLKLGCFSLRVHQWVRSDDKRAMHNHPWWFFTVILKGGYTDVASAPGMCERCGGIGRIEESYLGYKGRPPDTHPCERCRPFPEAEPIGCKIERDHVGQFGFRFRPAHHTHTVDVDPGGAWTFMVTGPDVNRWGFFMGGKFLKRSHYFRKRGHHPCDQP